MATVNTTLSFDDSILPAMRLYAPLHLGYSGPNTNAAKDAFLKAKLAETLKEWIIQGAVQDASATARANAIAATQSIVIT